MLTGLTLFSTLGGSPPRCKSPTQLPADPAAPVSRVLGTASEVPAEIPPLLSPPCVPEAPFPVHDDGPHPLLQGYGPVKIGSAARLILPRVITTMMPPSASQAAQDGADQGLGHQSNAVVTPLSLCADRPPSFPCLADEPWLCLDPCSLSLYPGTHHMSVRFPLHAKPTGP